ncbi:pseudaminic acid synthase [Sphingopyxis sp.]|uniref:pseudaminic acid synthase n=1 Tax=Sphingopyxis sp. TaxID=1908224 RepID=UPI002FCAF2A3
MTEKQPLTIGSHRLGAGCPPLIIAELSGNHNGSLDRALELVDVAADAGAHAVKLQTYTADTMTIDLSDREFFISDPGSLWEGESLYALYQKAMTPWEWHKPIFDRCRERGVLGFSSPFDATAVEFLEELGVPCYKVASFENIDLPLIRKVSATGKPVIISTGMATIGEIDEAVTAAREAGCKDLVLLKCTSSYPAPPENSNLANIPHMAEMFDCHIGFSDHTLGIGVAVAAAAFGAVVIEKHFTLRRDEGGVDAAFSSEPDELAAMVQETARAAVAFGDVRYGPSEADTKSLQFRRSLYIVEDMKAGEVLTPANLRAIRPGLGLPPKFIGQLMGRKIARDIARGTAASWDIFT